MDQYNRNNSGNKPSQNNPDPNKKGRSAAQLLVILFLITVVLNVLFTTFITNKKEEVEYSQFIELVESGSVEKTVLDQDQIEIQIKKDADPKVVNEILYSDIMDPSEYEKYDSSNVFYTGYVDDPDMVATLREHDVSFYKPIIRSSPILSFIVSWIIPIAIMYFLYSFLFRNVSQRMGGGMMNVGKSKAKEYSMESDLKVKFSDVAGQDEAKESLKEMVDFLHDPSKYQAIGAKQPKGALLVGPPGTGKTLLARAVAGESKVPFYSLSGSEFVEMFVGVGASRVRDLFEQAKKTAPSIIFIDEIDAIGKSRDAQLSSNDEREQTLNQLLAEMDGFDSSEGIVVLAATNRPEVLDKALLRPGRFDRRIIVELPDLRGREAILKIHAAKVKLGPDVNLNAIALATSGASGADLANMVNESALRAVKMGRHAVIQEDLMEAVEVVIAGREMKDRILNEKEKKIVSYHEVGHALVSALQKNSQPVTKITIVPRTMGSLGYTMNVPAEERFLMTKDEILAQITTLLGGRAAEIVTFGEISTGASNDIERATHLARGMITLYGMSETFGPMALEDVQSQYLDGRPVFTGSEKSSELVDQEVSRILEDCQDAAVDMLKDNKDALNRIAEHLMEKENITGEEFMDLLKKTNEEKNNTEDTTTTE